MHLPVHCLARRRRINFSAQLLRGNILDFHAIKLAKCMWSIKDAINVNTNIVRL